MRRFVWALPRQDREDLEQDLVVARIEAARDGADVRKAEGRAVASLARRLRRERRTRSLDAPLGAADRDRTLYDLLPAPARSAGQTAPIDLTPLSEGQRAALGLLGMGDAIPETRFESLADLRDCVVGALICLGAAPEDVADFAVNARDVRRDGIRVSKAARKGRQRVKCERCGGWFEARPEALINGTAACRPCARVPVDAA